ncbi:MAG: acetate--CoA ligase family protein [Candidatus Peregrinibacteria bacterium]
MSLLSPASVAVIGTSTDERKIGHLILRNLLIDGYKGVVYPINPKGGEILGKAVVTSVSAIAGALELAVIVTPAETVASLAEECGKKGVKTLVVISAGFGESGEDGQKHETELVKIAEKYGMQLIGPNCLGFMRPSLGLNASFGKRLPPVGSVALISQSGALGNAFIDRASGIGLGFSFFVSTGNKASMDECDFLRILANDPETKVIGLYLENIRHGREFLDLAREIGATKPVILLKAGTSEKGRNAVSSHTGALAGSDATVEAIAAQAGIWRASGAEHFLDLLRTHATQPTLLSSAIAIITNAGGPGVLAADAAEREHLLLPALEAKNDQELKAKLPSAASTKNPIDVLGDAMSDRYETAIDFAMEDPGIDGIVVICTPQIVTPSEAIAKAMVTARQHHPLMPIVACFMGNEGVIDAIHTLEQNGIPNFQSPETAIQMLGSLRKPKGQVEHPEPVAIEVRRTKNALAILSKAKTGLLSEDITDQLLKLYGLTLPRAHVAKTADDAVRIAGEIGFPVTAKVSSQDILHKTEVGGVRLNLINEKDLRTAFDEILKSVKSKAPKAKIDGILVQQFLPPGSEFIVGALRDPSVGHLVMAGLGGIYTELFADASFRVAPIGPEEAVPMLTRLRSWKLLLGLRGKPALDIPGLTELISKISFLVTECPMIREIDLNPVLVSENGVTILDAKIVVTETPEAHFAHAEFSAGS